MMIAHGAKILLAGSAISQPMFIAEIGGLLGAIWFTLGSILYLDLPSVVNKSEQLENHFYRHLTYALGSLFFVLGSGALTYQVA